MVVRTYLENLLEINSESQENLVRCNKGSLARKAICINGANIINSLFYYIFTHIITRATQCIILKTFIHVCSSSNCICYSNEYKRMPKRHALLALKYIVFKVYYCSSTF